ncbi:MAG: amino acid ABC transporter permease [Ruminococcus sp.]|nr:amino acid ABC transporter permease [Ruminococcus sp.]
MDQFWNVTLTLLEGFTQNCTIFLLTLVMAIPLGILLSFGSMSKFFPLKGFVRAIVWAIRGTPLLLQLFVVFYIPSLVWDISFNRMTAAMIAFVINYAAYFSEIFRGGMEGISKGQYEAGQVLGMKKSQIFFRIILMQVIKRIVTPISNEIITLIKDTSLARVIMVPEMLKVSERFTVQGLIWPLFYTGVFFLLFNGVLTLLFSFMEKKLNYYKG